MAGVLKIAAVPALLEAAAVDEGAATLGLIAAPELLAAPAAAALLLLLGSLQRPVAVVAWPRLMCGSRTCGASLLALRT